jgi:hypothetical protein
MPDVTKKVVNIATVATSEGKTDRNALGEDRRPSKEV